MNQRYLDPHDIRAPRGSYQELNTNGLEYVKSCETQRLTAVIGSGVQHQS